MGNAFDGSRYCSADSIIDASFGIMLLHYDHIAAHLFDILLQTLDVQWLQRKDVQHTDSNGID